MTLRMVKSRPNTNISWYPLRASHLRLREGYIVIIYVDVSEHLTGVAHHLWGGPLCHGGEGTAARD